jgi:hypothetical protein
MTFLNDRGIAQQSRSRELTNLTEEFQSRRAAIAHYSTRPRLKLLLHVYQATKVANVVCTRVLELSNRR